MKRFLFPVLIAVLATSLFAGLLYVDFYQTLDSRMYDLMLRIKPGIKEEDKILLLEIDDQMITKANVYPIPREMFADGLILLKEFNPAWTMLDIEFVDKSEKGINWDYLNYTLPDSVYADFNNLSDYQRQFFELVINGTITKEEAEEYLNDLQQATADTSDKLVNDIQNVTFSRDEYLGKALKYLKNVTATINMTADKDDTVPEELREYAINNLNINKYLKLNYDPFDKAVDIKPAIMPVLSSAAWAGFPRMYIDPDGVRRRVDILFQYNGNYFTHLGFGTWWVRAGKPEITVDRWKVEAGGLKIPLDRNGKMLINWPKRLYDGTPLNKRKAKSYDPSNPEHRLSFYYLYLHDQMMKDLSDFIYELESYGITADLASPGSQFLSSMENDLNSMKQAMLDSGDGSRAQEYKDYRDMYLKAAADFFSSGIDSAVLDNINSILSSGGLSEDEKSYYSSLKERVEYLFPEGASLVSDIQKVRKHLYDKINGATIVAGYTGTSTTDYGANPFERKYMNMGIYGAVYNSFLRGEFLRETPIWIAALLSFLAGIIVSFLSNLTKNNSTANTVIGGTALVVILAAGGSVFIISGVYIHMLTLFLVMLSVYLGTIIGNFISTAKEKAFIENAFDQVISPDVVKRIQDNPSMLNVGGEKRIITAMFTDIEKFSTISEAIGSSDKLFELLKSYLTPMSDIILDELGTIDKYEGDAIIAFWNAPMDLEDHAVRACRAALRIAKKEKEINSMLVDKGILTGEILKSIPHGHLYTRIGINTGENNVGFIGTERRKDYTALGDEMNLASRLEGVNKLYGTQILISGETEKIIHAHFITRQLDLVRVMGKSKPVAIYELTCMREDFSDKRRESFNLYREGLTLFRKKDWNEAIKYFNKVLDDFPEDGPSRVFVERCEKYSKNPPPANWDGVYKMETK